MAEDSIMEDTTTFMDLSTEVRHKIFDSLEARHLLRVRLTCKKLKKEVDDFPGLPVALQHKRSKEKINWVKINGANVYRFMEEVTSLPLTAFSVLNYTPLTYENLIASRFVEAYGSKIKKLRLECLYECRLDSEWEFLESLRNLEHLEIMGLLRLKYSDIAKGREDLLLQLRKSEDCTRFPKTCLRNVKNITIYRASRYDTTYDLDFILNRYTKSLETVRLYGGKNPLSRWRDQIIWRLVDYLQFKQDYSGVSKVKEIIFDHVYISQEELTAFYSFYAKSKHSEEEDRVYVDTVKELEHQFVELVGAASIKIKTIHIAFLDSFLRWVPHEKFQRFLPCVSTMVGISPVIKRFELPNLEKVEFSNGTFDLDMRGWDEAPGCLPDWPKVKIISGVIDVANDSDGDLKKEKAESVRMNQLIRFLYRSKLRPEVHELMLNEQIESDDLEHYADNPSGLSWFVPEDIVLRFPYLKKLDLVMELFDQKNYIDLLSLLGKQTKLEDLAIVIPERFAGKALFGIDPENPVFLQLTHLKVLSLETTSDAENTAEDVSTKLDDVITDEHFLRIFSQMKLEDFTLYLCESSNGNVTSHGIISLIKGTFVKSIREFSLTTNEYDELDDDEGVEEQSVISEDEASMSYDSDNSDSDAVEGESPDKSNLTFEPDDEEVDLPQHIKFSSKNEEKDFEKLAQWTQLFKDNSYAACSSALEADVRVDNNSYKEYKDGLISLEKEVMVKAISIIRLYCRKNCLK